MTHTVGKIKKRTRSAPPERESLMKRRREVHETVSKLKKEGKSEKEGVFAIAARMLNLKPDTIRNDYKAEEDRLRTNPHYSSMAYPAFNDGAPTSKVISFT